MSQLKRAQPLAILPSIPGATGKATVAVTKNYRFAIPGMYLFTLVRP